uniref:Uncharacterized protein n=1 Tax=Leersia perrieri TaxID=77586 RepID=A0A0D9VJ81_9ORYZ
MAHSAASPFAAGRRRRRRRGATGEGPPCCCRIRRLPYPPTPAPIQAVARVSGRHRRVRGATNTSRAQITMDNWVRLVGVDEGQGRAYFPYDPGGRYIARRLSFGSLGVDMNYYNLGPISGQVLQRPKEGTSAVLNIVLDGHEHLFLVGRRSLLLQLVTGVQQRARRRADAAASAPHGLHLSAVAARCCFLTLRNDKHEAMQLQSNHPAKPKSTDGGGASSSGRTTNDGLTAVSEAAFIRGSTTFHTSPVRSGRRLRLISAQRRPRCASWLACTNGQLPADGSRIECSSPLSIASSTTSAIFCGGLPVSSRRIMIPKEYTSERGVISPEVRNSGSMYAKVPFGVVVRYSLVVAKAVRRQMPKSPSLLTRLASRRMFAGFRSPWTIGCGLFEWRNVSAEHIS